MIPFLLGLLTASRKKKEIADKLIAEGHKANRRRLEALALFRLFLATFFVTLVLFINYNTTAWPIVFISLSIIVFLFFAHKNFKVHQVMEDRFLSNLRQREEHEKQNNAEQCSISAQLSNNDIHLATVTVSPDSPFIGKTLNDLNLRKSYNINIVKITRGHKEIHIPDENNCIYPSDILTVIGTDENITSFENIMEIVDTDIYDTIKPEVEVKSFLIKEDSFLLNKNLNQSGCRESGCLIIEIERGSESFINPDESLVFQEGDLVWIAGFKDKIQHFV